MRKIAFDASVLIELHLRKRVPDRQIRLESLQMSLNKGGSVIVLPAPAVTESLIRSAEDQDRFLNIFQRPPYKIAAFGERAMVECAVIWRDAHSRKEQRTVTKAKFKFDLMIAAIAKVEGVECLYHDDADLERICKRIQLHQVRIGEIPIADELATPLLTDANDGSEVFD